MQVFSYTYTPGLLLFTDERNEIYRYGFKCRFLGGHIRISEESGELSLVDDEDKKARAAVTAREVNFVGPDVQKVLRSRKVRYSSTLFMVNTMTRGRA